MVTSLDSRRGSRVPRFRSTYLYTSTHLYGGPDNTQRSSFVQMWSSNLPPAHADPAGAVTIASGEWNEADQANLDWAQAR
jgi:hypothetical protein